MARKSQPVDWDAALAGIAGGNTILECAANRDIVSKHKELFMAPNKSLSGVAKTKEKTQIVDWEALLAGISRGKSVLEYGANRTIYRQGDPADSVFYIRRGKVKHGLTSQQGKESIVALLGDGDFFGEGGLAGRPLRIATATATTDCTLAPPSAAADLSMPPTPPA